MAPIAGTTSVHRCRSTPCAFATQSGSQSFSLQKPSQITRYLDWGQEGANFLKVNLLKRPQNGRRFRFRCRLKGAEATSHASVLGFGPFAPRREQLERVNLIRRDVSVAARKSRSMGEMEDEEEGFQSLVKQMQSQQKKPPSAPASKPAPKKDDPYAEFAALLDYQDKNDGLLPPPKTPRASPPSPITPRPVEPVKPRVISRAGARVAGLSGLKVPNPTPAGKKRAHSGVFPTYDDELSVNKPSVSAPVSPLGGSTEYKLGDSGAVQVTPQGEFPVRLKGHKVPKRKKWEEESVDEPFEVPSAEYDAPSQAEIEEMEVRAASGLAALQAGGLGSANPKSNSGDLAESFLPGRGKEYTLAEEGSDVSVASASSFPVRTKSHREPKGGYSMAENAVVEKKPEPKKPTKRVPSFQELVSGAAKIVDPSIPNPVTQPALKSVVEDVAATEAAKTEVKPGDDISGPRVYTLGEDDGSVSVEAAESIPVRLKALRAEKLAGSAPPEKAKEGPKKVAQRVPGFQLPSDVRESGLPKKKAVGGSKTDGTFRPVAAQKAASADLSGGMFAEAKRFLTSRGAELGDTGVSAVRQVTDLKDGLGEKLTSAQAEVLEKALSVVERKARAEAQGALIVPVVEGKKKVKGKKERTQILAAFPKWKEDYEKVCIDADYALRQLDGLAIEIGRSQQSEVNEQVRRSARAARRGESGGDPLAKGNATVTELPVALAEVSKSAADVSHDDPGAQALDSESVEALAEGGEDERVESGDEAAPDEPPNWEDDPEDIDLTAYESDSDDEQAEGEAKPEFEVKLPPPRASATEFREDDAYATFASMLGDDEDSEDDENSPESVRGESLASLNAEEPAGSGNIDNTVGANLGSQRDAGSETAERSTSPAPKSDAAPSAEGSEGASPAALDRERLSSQIFELLRGTTEGEKKQFGQTDGVLSPTVQSILSSGTPGIASLVPGRPDSGRTPSDPNRTADGPARAPVDSNRTAEGQARRPAAPSQSPLESLLASEKLASKPVDSVRTPEDSGRTPVEPIRTPAGAVRTPLAASGWSEEVQSAVAKAEAEREMARKRQAPDYGTFEELLKEEDGIKSEKPSATAPSPEELARVTRPPTLKDQRAPFVRAAKPLKPAVPNRGPVVPPTPDSGAVMKPRWVRVWDVDNREEEGATAREWAQAEALCPNKEAVEVLVVNYNMGGLQVLFGTLLGFLPASQLSLAKRPPRPPEWMAQAMTPKDYRNLPRGGAAPPSPSGGEKQPGAPEEFDQKTDESADQSDAYDVPGEDEVDYVTSGIVPETDEQLAIAARQVRAYRTAHLASLVGQRLTVKIIVADRAQKKLIFSERSAVWKEGHDEAISRLLARIKIGDVVRGTVKAIMKYGAFIEVDGASCLIHKSELAWVTPKHPGELLHAQQEVEAVVVAVDRAVGRVNCSLKRLQPDPLTETLDSLVERAPAEGEDSILTEMPELGDVIELLKTAPGVGEVRLGRRFRGTAFAPSFQIFLSEKVDNGYRLLARVGVEVQEVLVATELERDIMKQVVRDATVSNSSERRLALADFAS